MKEELYSCMKEVIVKWRKNFDGFIGAVEVIWCECYKVKLFNIYCLIKAIEFTILKYLIPLSKLQ